MNKKYIVSLSEAEQSQLSDLIQSRKARSSVVLNAQVLLACDRNGPNLGDEEVSGRYHLSPVTVQRIREKFVLHGLEVALKGLRRGPRTKQVKIDGEVEAHLIQLACSQAPAGYQRWSLRLLADKLVELQYVDSISYEGVRQVLKKMNLSLGEKPCG